jgi:hypothetical protein
MVYVRAANFRVIKVSFFSFLYVGNFAAFENDSPSPNFITDEETDFKRI